LYIKAFQASLSKILDLYQKEILSLEQITLDKADNCLPLSHLQSIALKWEIIFGALLPLTESTKENEDQNFHGCSLLSLLYKSYISCGIPSVASTLIFFHCNKVLYDQVTAWLVHGLLIDKQKEFFIQKGNSNTEIKTKSIGWDAEHSIAISLLPCFISTQLAEKILFVGKAVRLLQQHKETDQTNSFTVADIITFTNALRQLGNADSFHIISFECVVEDIRLCVAKHLWQLVVVHADLFGQLKTLKNFYFLFSGDFYQCFIHDSKATMMLPPKQNAEHDINLLFQHAAIKTSAENDKYFNGFYLQLPVDKESGQISWNNLKLDYKEHHWALDLLLSQEHFNKYNSIFAMLFDIKRAQIELQKAWKPQKEMKKLTLEKRNPLMPTWLLRKKMAFLVDNLQYYFQVGVLDVQYSLMISQIETSTEFDAISKAHDESLTSSYHQCFMHIKAVIRCLDVIVQLCISFCGFLVSKEDEQVDPSKITEVSKEFDKQSALLFTLLMGIKNNKQSPALAHLLFVLDYNKHFTELPATKIKINA